MPAANADIIRQLQRDILPLQGFKPPTTGKAIDFHLGPLESAFPNNRFPTGAVHEFISKTPSQSAVTKGFIAALLAPLMQNGSACLWIGNAKTLFPHGFSIYGVPADRLLLLDLPGEKDRCWAMEEALKCESLAAVVGEIRDISFTDSRRLQLAVEQSRVTGFLLRQEPRHLGTVAAVARWEITSLASEPEEGLPGIGFPRWQTTLHRVRNGRPGTWEMEWSAGRFHFPDQPATQMAPQSPFEDAPAAPQQVPLIRTAQKRQTG